MNQIKEALYNIIENKYIRTVFQPIISLRDGSVLGHEALSRITIECEIKDPDMLFKAAGVYNRVWELEQLCRTKALETAYLFMIPPYSKKLFVNVNPDVMHDEQLKKGFTKAFLEKYEIEPRNVIFEITERNIVTDMTAFKATINHYKTQDYQIAIDDTGAGYSGLNLISDINPNYIKIDMNLIRNIDKDSLKYALVKGLVEFSRISNVFLIAEGIETYQELETIVNLGVQYGQGYFIQRPISEVSEIDTTVLNALKEINIKRNHDYRNNISNLYIRNICTDISTISPNMMVTEVYQALRKNLDHIGYCIVEDNVPVGIITKEKLTFHLSGHYGFSLYQNKTISKIMDTQYLSVDYKTPVNVVSALAMARPNDKLYDFIVVTQEKKYLGIVTIKDLLKRTTEIEVSEAKHLNPLTGLPGNLAIEQRMKQCIDNRLPFTAFYIDIDNFKAFNDVYGFEKGDLVIKILADTLKHYTSDEQFVGHIGGDDFIVIIDKYVDESFYGEIVQNFERDALKLYNETDVNNGYITVENRRGVIEKFPLIRLTIVSASNKTEYYCDTCTLAEALAYRKRMKKLNK